MGYYITSGDERAMQDAHVHVAVGRDTYEPVAADDVGASTIFNVLAGDPIRFAAMAAGAYHGYKRTGKWGWAAVYAGAGGISPLITAGVILMQGFAKRKGALATAG